LNFSLFKYNLCLLIFHCIFLYPQILFQWIILVLIWLTFILLPKPQKSIIASISHLSSIFLEKDLSLERLIKAYSGTLVLYIISIASGILGTINIYPLFGYFSIFSIFIITYYLNRLTKSKTYVPSGKVMLAPSSQIIFVVTH